MVCSRCKQKTLNNFTCLPNPPTLGDYPQLLISDGNEGTQWSNSLLGEEAAVLSAYVAADYTVPPTTAAGIQLVTTGPTPVSLGLDFSATTTRAFSIFNAFTGQNLTSQTILVSVNYSVNFEGTTQGDKGVWVQIIGADLIVKAPRYGFSQQKPDGDGNHLTGSTIIGLAPMEAAAFFVLNAGNNDVEMLGGPIDSTPLATKFQSGLLN